MIRNDGHFPGMARGKRVRVVLANGADSAAFDPPHWPADTLDWTLGPAARPSSRFDIEFFEVIA